VSCCASCTHTLAQPCTHTQKHAHSCACRHLARSPIFFSVAAATQIRKRIIPTDLASPVVAPGAEIQPQRWAPKIQLINIDFGKRCVYFSGASILLCAKFSGIQDFKGFCTRTRTIVLANTVLTRESEPRKRRTNLFLNHYTYTEKNGPFT